MILGVCLHHRIGAWQITHQLEWRCAA